MPRHPSQGGGSGSGSGDGRKPPGAPAPQRTPTSPGATKPPAPRPVSRPALNPLSGKTSEGSSPNLRPLAQGKPTKSGSYPQQGASDFDETTASGAKPLKTSSGPAKSTPGHTPPGGLSSFLPAKLSGVGSAEEARKQILTSDFGDDERSQFDVLTGKQRRWTLADDEEEEATAVDQVFDGETPAKGVTSREMIAIVAPLQSREGRRSQKIYQLVIDQFAVGKNPRYDPDAPGKPRGHIFVWDVTRALNVEVPHFYGGRELGSPQTCNWLRQEGPGLGWHRVPVQRAVEAAGAGMPVLVMPKDVKIALIAVARPKDLDPSGRPLLSAAALKRGNKLTVQDAFGVPLVDYFLHG
ncbi:MAG: hypothetical protein HYZ28_20765 [Myxococcales bacterium]|nr:hypothetical protein [Myxococcales bacterium]